MTKKMSGPMNAVFGQFGDKNRSCKTVEGRQRALGHLAEIESVLGLPCDTLIKGAQSGNLLSDSARQIYNLSELLTLWCGLTDNDQRRCLEFVQSLAVGACAFQR